jgi:DNA-binding beta-propeller fold protein YncE
MNLGQGSYTYEWDGNWAKLPAGKSFGYTHGIRADVKDNIYVFNQSKDAICTFDKDGNFIRSWGEKYAKGAHGLFLSTEKEGQFLYLADYELQEVAKYTLDGKEVLQFKIPPREDIYMGKPYKPTDTCVAPNGDVYIFDGYGTPYVHRYDKGGKYIQSIGGPGNGAGQLSCPHGGWVDTRRGDPELYVADRGNNRIQVFSLDGKHKRFIKDEQDMPCNFFEFKGDLYIPDLHSRVTILDKNDKFVVHLGSNKEAWNTTGWPNIQDKLQEGKFNSPHNLGVDSQGNIYVAEWISTGRVTKLKRKPM